MVSVLTKRYIIYVLVKIRAGVFYQDLKTRAEGEIFKSDKTRTTTCLKSSSSCELRWLPTVLAKCYTVDFTLILIISWQ